MRLYLPQASNYVTPPPPPHPQVTLISELDANNLLPLVEAIPDSISSSQLASWLTGNVMPFLLQYASESLVWPFYSCAVIHFTVATSLQATHHPVTIHTNHLQCM